MKRLYRLFLVFSAAVIGGLALYYVTRGPALRLGENGAAIWSWFSIFAIGYLAHRLLPKDDLSRVSRILLAILASAATMVLSAYLTIVILDLDGVFEDGLHWYLLFIGLIAAGFSVAVFLPLHIVIKQERAIHIVLFVLPWILIPSALVLTLQPFGEDNDQWLAWEAVVCGAIGGSSALVFRLIASSRKAESQ